MSTVTGDGFSSSCGRCSMEPYCEWGDDCVGNHSFSGFAGEGDATGSESTGSESTVEVVVVVQALPFVIDLVSDDEDSGKN